ncbi:neuropeptides capa receptor-like [Athalia rosae]|uniref:neuropeptides capa receptor-like n=1 Tax=Athalia rosae TaxID=37344 RepID=UPI00203428DA|nr:neuropeptides capa receptor-like [Athalia rosae]
MADVNLLPAPEGNFSLENITESDYLAAMLGPKHLPRRVVIPVTVVYLTIFVTGVFGNGATCWVIVRNPVMQTATNYYLFSLAVSDLTLLLLGLPNELSVFWQQYPWAFGLYLCKLRAFVSEMSSYVSVLTIVAFSMERYLAICHPLHLYAMSGLKRPSRFILAAWVVALVCALPFAIYTTVYYVEFPIGSGLHVEDSAICAMLQHSMPPFPLYELSCVIFFFIPMLFILILYVRMGLKIRSKSIGRSIEGSVHGETRQAQSKKAIIRMLSAVVVMFFICWAPFHAQRLLYVHARNSAYYAEINEWLYALGGCLYYFSTTVNPILYNVMSAKYRGAFKETLCCSPASPAFTRDDISSMRETAVCGCDGTITTSQLVRIRSLHYSRTVRCTLDHSEEVLNPPGRTRTNQEGNGRVQLRNIRQNNNFENQGSQDQLESSNTEALLDPKKTSMIIQASNGKPKCHTTSTHVSLDETRI